MTPQGMLRGLTADQPLFHVAGPEDVWVRDVSCDSREVAEGSCFVAVSGHRYDGHDYIGQALDNGAAAIILQKGHENALPSTPAAACYTSPDSRQALGWLARSYRANPDVDLRLIAITGTNGKTTVSHVVQALLNTLDQPAGLMGTMCYETGVRSIPAPLTTPDVLDFYRLLEEMRGAELVACVFEASSHALDQHRLGPAEIDVAAFTNLSREHLDYHADLASYFAAKRQLLEYLRGERRAKEPGRAVVNLEDPYFATAEWPSDVIGVGRERGCTVRLLEASTDREGTRISLELGGDRLEVKSQLLGSFNVENVLVALGIGHALGLTADQLGRAIPAVPPVPGRLEPLPLPNGPLVLIDYAHTPDALEKALGACRQLGSGRLSIVFGCGGNRDRGKRPLMAAAAASGADRVFLTTDNPRTEDLGQIFADAEAGFAGIDTPVATIPDRGEAIAAALSNSGSDDVVLVAGKGHETYQLIGTESLHWDDRDAIRRAWSGGAT